VHLGRCGPARLLAALQLGRERTAGFCCAPPRQPAECCAACCTAPSVTCGLGSWQTGAHAIFATRSVQLSLDTAVGRCLALPATAARGPRRCCATRPPGRRCARCARRRCASWAACSWRPRLSTARWPLPMAPLRRRAAGALKQAGDARCPLLGRPHSTCIRRPHSLTGDARCPPPSSPNSACMHSGKEFAQPARCSGCQAACRLPMLMRSC